MRRGESLTITRAESRYFEVNGAKGISFWYFVAKKDALRGRIL